MELGEYLIIHNDFRPTAFLQLKKVRHPQNKCSLLVTADQDIMSQFKMVSSRLFTTLFVY